MNDKLLKELKRRAEAKSFRLEDFCFDKQLAFIKDEDRFKTAVCSRRSGKTIACAADLMHTALMQKGDVAYITLNRITAKRIIWRELLKINEQFNIGAHADKQELTLTLPNGNIIYVSGAKDSSEIEKFRGLSLRKVYIDECQSFRSYIQELVEDVIEPALTDYYGKLCLIGTPGPVPAGYFYEASQNRNWSHHKWTMQENPHIALKSGKNPLDIIVELAARRNLTINDPSIQREYFGQWIKDVDSLVYRFDPVLNTVYEVPEKLTYIFGIDIGYRDADAIAVLGYSYTTQKVYLVEEKITTKQDITALVEQITELQKKYKPVKMVMDSGALGTKIQHEITRRHSIPVEAAEKSRKLEYIKLLNDDLRTGKFKALHGTRFAEDCMLVQWDYDDPAKPKISDIYHTDVGDAVLYAWRECNHFFAHLGPPNLDRNSDAFMVALEEKEADELEKKMKGNGNELAADDAEFIYSDDF